MGRAIEAAAKPHSDFEIVGTWGRNDDLAALAAGADVVIDFSLPEATATVLETATRLKRPLVCGVSGLDAAQMAAIERASAHIPLVYDRNMSLGIAVLEKVVRDAAASLGDVFAVGISEVHHVHKKDAPSGTALKLGEAIARARGAADASFIEYRSERRGEVPGDHEVTMSSANERLTFAHSVTTRQVFADGALRAARWVAGRPAGRYSMQDVLFT